ncbi:MULTISPECIES: 2'-5' RNA ligase family protein [Sphingobacterium]|uniref:2'-5' RNA ligase family protein n=1 Tax=Sphingobacterium TaxID=28453 RepID=UPI0013DCCBA5|nr:MULTISPECIES: 2'-5' RNA ligase family protein [unclassified Sphingobacterium]
MESVKVSLAFVPCESVNAKIRNLKENLKSVIGWYSSCNSAGHVTICEFETTRDELKGVASLLIEKLQYEHAQHVYFNDYSIFQHGNTYTYYIVPTVQSKYYFNQRSAAVIDALKDRFSLKSISKEPHLSIGRKLEEGALKDAKSSLKQIDLDFYCDSVYIRVFNPDVKQYDIFFKIPFGGKERLLGAGQLSFNF